MKLTRSFYKKVKTRWSKTKPSSKKTVDHDCKSGVSAKCHEEAEELEEVEEGLEKTLPLLQSSDSEDSSSHSSSCHDEPHDSIAPVASSEYASEPALDAFHPPCDNDDSFPSDLLDATQREPKRSDEASASMVRTAAAATAAASSLSTNASSSSTQTRRRRVTMDETVEVVTIQPLELLAPSGRTVDKRQLWYQADEYKEITWKAWRQVKRIHYLNSQIPEGCDGLIQKKQDYEMTRGLEYILKRADEASNNSAKSDAPDNATTTTTNSSNAPKKKKIPAEVEAVLAEQTDQKNAILLSGRIPDPDKIASLAASLSRTHVAEAVHRAKWDASEARRRERALPRSASAPANALLPRQPSSSRRPRGHATTTKQRSSIAVVSRNASARAVATAASPAGTHRSGMMMTRINHTLQRPPGIRL